MEKILKAPTDINKFLEELTFQNYHRHSSYSNPTTPDSGAMNRDYAKRAIEVGSKIICSCEHGFQGNYFEVYDLAEEYGLKFIFGAEAYWVKDRFEKDAKNNHIVLLAKNEKGRRAINLVLSEANETGYYYKPRLDLELILSLPANDVFVTTACIGFWKYDDIEDIVVKLHNHFKENFMLEIQYHYTPSQIKLNKRILEISKKYGIEMIMGCDSHFIYPNQSKDRDYILAFKGIRYDDELSWHMDYPTTKEAFQRFKKQNIFSDLEILNAINNTNLILEFEDIHLSKDIKLPTIFPNYTQEEKDKHYKEIIMKEWNKYKEENNIPKEEWNRYKEGIKAEVKTVIDTKMSDYFIFDYYAVKKAKERGGMMTPTGRGSGVSFFTNTLLGFSNVNRFIAPVHLFPERFMSAARINDAVSLPDLDLNEGNPEVFVEAQEELLGKGHCYPMIAWGTLKKKSAWKMYAGANDVDFEIANAISNQLEEYEKALKYAEDDEKDDIFVEDFIEEKYIELFKESEKYQGIISDKKKHPCGYLLYMGDIREEIGLIKCKSETTKKEYMVALIDGAAADKFKYLKNDNLKVDVVKSNYLVAQRAGINVPTIKQLTDIVTDDEKIWNIYKDGWTLGVNQVEKASTTKKITKYQPKTIAELCCFIAAIRPAFKSMYSIFEKRERFNYGIPSFDNVIQNEHIKDSFIFFQEQIMAALAFGGVPIAETYTLVKAISKKKDKVIKSYKDIFLNGFSKKVVELEGKTHEEAYEIANKVWTIIYDAAGYGFNASHSLCVSYDSLYGAYHKVYNTYEFYEVMLNMYTEKGNNEKVAAFKQEMFDYAGITLGVMKFGYDNRKFTLDKENKCIHPSLVGIKGIGQKDADSLYELSKNQYNNFIELYADIKNTTVNVGKMEILIKLDYFSYFGKSKKLLKLMEIYNSIYDRKQFSKDKLVEEGLSVELVKKYAAKETAKLFKEVDILGMMDELVSKVEDVDIPIKEKLLVEKEYVGYPYTVIEQLKNTYFVEGVDEYKNKTSTTYYLNLYSISTGERDRFKLKDYETFEFNPIKENDLIIVGDISIENKRKQVPKFDSYGKPVISKKTGKQATKWVELNDEFWKILMEWRVI